MWSLIQQIERVRRRALICIVLALAVWSCSDSVDPIPDEKVLLRLENLSPYLLKQVTVRPGTGGEQVYTDVNPGQTTAFQPYDFIYRYAYIQAIIGSDTLTLDPKDYSQEEQFLEGNYTYLINITTEQGRPGFMFVDFRED